MLKKNLPRYLPVVICSHLFEGSWFGLLHKKAVAYVLVLRTDVGVSTSQPLHRVHTLGLVVFDCEKVPVRKGLRQPKKKYLVLHLNNIPWGLGVKESHCHEMSNADHDV